MDLFYSLHLVHTPDFLDICIVYIELYPLPKLPVPILLVIVCSLSFFIPAFTPLSIKLRLMTQDILLY